MVDIEFGEGVCNRLEESRGKLCSVEEDCEDFELRFSFDDTH